MSNAQLRFRIPNAYFRKSQRGFRLANSELRVSKFAIRNSKFESQNSKFEDRKAKCGIVNTFDIRHSKSEILKSEIVNAQIKVADPNESTSNDKKHVAEFLEIDGCEKGLHRKIQKA